MTTVTDPPKADGLKPVLIGNIEKVAATDSIIGEPEIGAICCRIFGLYDRLRCQTGGKICAARLGLRQKTLDHVRREQRMITSCQKDWVRPLTCRE